MCGLAAALAVFAASPVWAAAYQVEARTEAQAYQFRAYRNADPDNPVLLPRRRIAQYLGLNVYELVTGQPLGFESFTRVYADFGLPQGEAARIDGLQSEEADILYANVFYRTAATELRLGRQVYVDLMDYMAFDGLKARYVNQHGPRFLRGLGAEAHAGLWVKAGSILGSSVYQPDGIRDSDARRLALQVPGAQPYLDDFQPVYGAKLLAENVMGQGVSGSVGYRKALLGGQTDLERLAIEARYGRGRGVNVLGGVDYDLFMARVGQARLTARYDHVLYAVTAEVMRVAPVLSADSIFYYFATAPRDEARLRGDYTPIGPFRYYAQLLGDFYSTNLNSNTDTYKTIQALETIDEASRAPVERSIPSTAFGGSLGSALRWGPFRSAADLTYKSGFGGRQLWFDLTGGYVPEDAFWTIDARISIADIADGFNPRLQGTFFGAQAWASYLFTSNARASLMLEQNVNRFTRSDTKLFLVFDLRALL